MKKGIVWTAFLFIALFVFAGCKCEEGQHDYVSEIKQEASCSAEGVRKFKCSICGDTYTEAIETIPHNYVASEKAATCTEEGVRTFTCSVCGDAYTKTIEMIEHNYIESEKAATCTEEGVRTFTCDACGDTYTEPIEKIAHRYIDSIQRAATCEEKGVKSFVCKYCGDTNTEDIDALGHTWADATCTKPKTCTRCGRTEGGTIPHTYSDGQCTACGASAPKYALNDAVSRGKIDVKIVMSSIKSGRINVKNLTDEYIVVTVPAGTYFIASSASNQNMLVTSPASVPLPPGSSKSQSLSTACMNIKRDIPDSKAGYTVGYSSSSVFQNLVNLFEENKSPYGVRQAAVWIVTDNATYEDTGTLVSNGGKVISLSDYNEAKRLVSLARGY